jgi:hypothetical protein
VLDGQLDQVGSYSPALLEPADLGDQLGQLATLVL